MQTTMKVFLCVVGLILSITASPQGYYHQEYNYKSSSSSFKNNELQHQTDDSGSYSKSGDLEGRIKPKVKSNSEHSEYVNPKLQEGYYNGNADLTSGSTYGVSSGASHGAYGSYGSGSSNSAYGTAESGAVNSAYGASGHNSHGSAAGYQAGSQYGTNLQSRGQVVDNTDEYSNNYNQQYGSQSSSEQYSTSSSLNNVASRLQYDLQQEILQALQDQTQYSPKVNVADLEAELRRNLTARLQELLQEQYGTQTVYNGQSYSLVGGRLQKRPNYEQQDLLNVQNTLQNNLLQQLRKEYSTKYSSGQQHSYNQNNYHNYETTTYRPIYPNLNTAPTHRTYPVYPSGNSQYQLLNNHQQQTDYNRVSNVRYTPVANPLSITTIATQTQNHLDAQLNELLHQAQQRYFSDSSSYTAYSLDSVLNQLKDELKNNLTYALDNALREQYGQQIQKDGYLYSVGSSGQVSGQYNYNAADLSNLKQQVENNLLTKLSRDFEAAKQSYFSTKQARYTNANQVHTGNYDYYGNGVKNTGVKTGGGYNVVSGSHQAGYEVSGAASNAAGGYGGSSGTINIANLQNQLQNQLSQQLQQAISKQYSTRLSSSGYSNAATFDSEYQRLYGELQRNLTRQLEDFLSEGGYSSYGANDAQFANLKSQLQNSLASQLQQGLRQSYSASASYSASSSGSSYGSSSSGGAYKGSQGYEAEACCGYRKKRDVENK